MRFEGINSKRKRVTVENPGLQREGWKGRDTAAGEEDTEYEEKEKERER